MTKMEIDPFANEPPAPRPSPDIDEAQMAADFATIPDPVNGPMRRARALVEAHIAEYGMVPHPDRIKEAIAIELGLAEIRGIDSARSSAVIEPTDEMVEAGCKARHSPQVWGRNLNKPDMAAWVNSHRVIMREILTAALSVAQPSAVREALELAEDVLSRAPFSTDIWPNGVHPNTGIKKIRAALALSSTESK